MQSWGWSNVSAGAKQIAGALALVIIVVLAARHAQAQACDTALLAKAQSAYQALAGFQGEFKQEDTETSGRVLTASGKIAYRKPGQMRWEYAAPNEQLLVTDGSTVWLYDPLLENVTVQPSPEMTSVRVTSVQIRTCRPLRGMSIPWSA